MSEQAQAPHHAHVRPDCPVECLRTALGRTCNHLTRAYRLATPPRTAGDVAGLHARGQLREILALGPAAISETGAALIAAGLDLGACQVRSAGRADPDASRLAGAATPRQEAAGRYRYLGSLLDAADMDDPLPAGSVNRLLAHCAASVLAIVRGTRGA